MLWPPDRSAAHRIAGNRVTGNQIENEVGCCPGALRQHRPTLGTEILHDLLGCGLEARVDLPAITPRSSPARLMRVKHDHVMPGLRQMERSRKSGQTAPITTIWARASPDREVSPRDAFLRA